MGWGSGAVHDNNNHDDDGMVTHIGHSTVLYRSRSILKKSGVTPRRKIKDAFSMLIETLLDLHLQQH